MNAETRKIIANAVAGDMLAEKTMLDCIWQKDYLFLMDMKSKTRTAM